MRPSPETPKQKPRRGLRAVLAIAILLVLTPLALIAYVALSAGRRTFADVSSVPAEPVAIVFGAGIRGADNLSPMLADRVQASVELYRSGRVSKILMTGDNNRIDYDEVTPMRRYAMAHGVPPQAIVLDYAGLSTYDSCYRARAIFGVTRAVLVTQRFHLPRALYTCRGMGIDAVGLGTPDWGVYPPGLMLFYTAREVLATLNALWQVNIIRPPPTFLGPYEGGQLSQGG